MPTRARSTTTIWVVPLAADVRPGSAATLALAARWFTSPTEFDGLSVGAAAGGEAYDRYHGLNNVWAVGTALYRHKFGVGLAAPWVLCELAAGYYDYNFNVRTGARFALRAEVGKRFSEIFDAEIGVFYDRRYGPYGSPTSPASPESFQSPGQGAYLRGAYAVTQNLLVSAKTRAPARRRRVDILRDRQIVGAATAIAEDPTFGDELYDYRLTGTTRTAAVAMSWALDERSSLNLTWTGESTTSWRPRLSQQRGGRHLFVSLLRERTMHDNGHCALCFLADDAGASAQNAEIRGAGRR